MEKRVLGSSGLEVLQSDSLHGMSHHRGNVSSRRVDCAYSFGARSWSDILRYGSGLWTFTNEQLVGDALAPLIDQVIIARSSTH